MVRIGQRLFGVISTKPLGTRRSLPSWTTSARRRVSSVGTSWSAMPSRWQRSVAHGILRDEAVGRAFDEIAVAVDGFEHAAESVGRLEDCQVERCGSEFGEAMGRREAADATADDGDAGHGGIDSWVVTR